MSDVLKPIDGAKKPSTASAGTERLTEIGGMGSRRFCYSTVEFDALAASASTSPSAILVSFLSAAPSSSRVS
jgi:hypothetical protein